MILRVEIVRRDSGDYVATLTYAGGYVEDVGPFGDLWEACSVVGGIDEYRETIAAELLGGGCCTHPPEPPPPEPMSAESLCDALKRAVTASRRRRGDTEPLTFDAAAAAAERLAGLKK